MRKEKEACRRDLPTLAGCFELADRYAWPPSSVLKTSARQALPVSSDRGGSWPEDLESLSRGTASRWQERNRTPGPVRGSFNCTTPQFKEEAPSLAGEPKRRQAHLPCERGLNLPRLLSSFPPPPSAAGSAGKGPSQRKEAGSPEALGRNGSEREDGQWRNGSLGQNPVQRRIWRCLEGPGLPGAGALGEERNSGRVMASHSPLPGVAPGFGYQFQSLGSRDSCQTRKDPQVLPTWPCLWTDEVTGGGGNFHLNGGDILGSS
ncbi:uncharacterized protein LOC120619311 [Pteropus medius]|uniref:uncharacterized protein LOC120619311 n=1 Tax=Pteropus vampyrus TaxID=132908 RepID=UPI00196AA29D|nr:uncharacterized protein LOC120619311 [Pteropus giganteus]